MASWVKFLKTGAINIYNPDPSLIMGTRGAYGFRINHKDKVTYNHFDSYPGGLGRDVLDYVANTPLETMVDAASRIILIEECSQPTAQLIQAYSKYADLGVSRQSYNDWYCLLRKTQRDLFPYNDDLRHMIDSHEFLHDSLFCEWAYIVNLDSQQFEAYVGFNKDPSAPGRYAQFMVEDNSGYYGVALVLERALSEIMKDTIDSLVLEIERHGRATVTAH